jgi:hypothetical protein
MNDQTHLQETGIFKDLEPNNGVLNFKLLFLLKKVQVFI